MEKKKNTKKNEQSGYEKEMFVLAGIFQTCSEECAKWATTQPA